MTASLSTVSTRRPFFRNLEFGTGWTLDPGSSKLDILISIENVIGTFWNDVLQGNEGNNRLGARRP